MAIYNDDVATWWCVHVVDGEALSKNAESLRTFCQKILYFWQIRWGGGQFRKCVHSKSFEALVWLLRSLKCFVDVSHAATLEWILLSESANAASAGATPSRPKSCRLNPRSCKSTYHNRKTSPAVILNQFQVFAIIMLPNATKELTMPM